MIRYFYHKIESIRVLLLDIAVCYFQISCVSLVQFLTVASHSYVSIDIVYYIPIFYVYFLLVRFLKAWKLAVAFPSYISIDIDYFFLPSFVF